MGLSSLRQVPTSSADVFIKPSIHVLDPFGIIAPRNYQNDFTHAYVPTDKHTHETITSFGRIKRSKTYSHTDIKFHNEHIQVQNNSKTRTRYTYTLILIKCVFRRYIYRGNVDVCVGRLHDLVPAAALTWRVAQCDSIAEYF